MGNLLGLQEDNERYRILLRVQVITPSTDYTRLTGEQLLLGYFCNDTVGAWNKFLAPNKNTTQSWAELKCIPYTPSLNTEYMSPYPFEPVNTSNLVLSNFGYSALTGYWLEFKNPFPLFQGNWNTSGLENIPFI